MMRVLCLIFLFGLSLTMALAQCEDASINVLLGKVESNDFSKKYLDSQPMPIVLMKNLDVFKNIFKKKGIFNKNRKISQSIICSQLEDIKFLIDKIDIVTQELKSQSLKCPKNDEVNSSINLIKNQENRFWEMRENLDSVKTIKGLSSFLNKNQYLYDILEQSFQLKQKHLKFLASYLLQKQKLDSDQFKFSLDYIPLLVEKQQLQNQLAIELTSLANKVTVYQSKKYNYIKYL